MAVDAVALARYLNDYVRCKDGLEMAVSLRDGIEVRVSGKTEHGAAGFSLALSREEIIAFAHHRRDAARRLLHDMYDVVVE